VVIAPLLNVAPEIVPYAETTVETAEVDPVALPVDTPPPIIMPWLVRLAPLLAKLALLAAPVLMPPATVAVPLKALSDTLELAFEFGAIALPVVKLPLAAILADDELRKIELSAEPYSPLLALEVLMPPTATLPETEMDTFEVLLAPSVVGTVANPVARLPAATEVPWNCMELLAAPPAVVTALPVVTLPFTCLLEPERNLTYEEALLFAVALPVRIEPVVAAVLV
jgi:hypothetical protein